MKNLLFTIGILLLSFGNAFAQDNSFDKKLQNVNQNKLTSGIIYDRVLPLADLGIYNMPAEKSHNTADFRFFQQALFELYKASNYKKLISINELEEKIIPYNKEMNIVPIGIINTPFQSLNYNPENPKEGGLILKDSLFVQIPEKEPFLNGYTLVVAPLKNVMQGEQIIFKFSEDLIFNNGEPKIKTLIADFGDGKKYSIFEGGKLINSEIKIENFKNNGDKTFHFTVTLSNDFTFNTNGKIYTVYGNAINNSLNTQPIACSNNNLIFNTNLIENFKVNYTESTDSFQGLNETVAIKGQIEPRVFYHTKNGTVDNNQKTLLKPILIIDGFDPSDGRKIDDCDCERDPVCQEAKKDKATGIYNPENHTSFVESMKYIDDSTTPVFEKNFITVLRAKGYDVILVNQPSYSTNGVTVDGGADFIERNAMAFVQLVKEVNTKLQTNGSTEKLVVMGPSMGGQISRYALAYMEKKFAETGNNSWQHNTRIWVAFDSPNHGANVPLGDQALIKLLAGDSAEAQKSFNKLQTIASNEMLVNYFKTVPLTLPFPLGVTIDSPNLNNSYSNASTTSQGMSTNEGNPYFKEHYNNQFNSGLPNSNGFPMNLRKLSIINGSLTGETFGNGYEKMLDVRLFKKICLINWNIFGWQVSSCFTTKLFQAESYSMPDTNNLVAYKMKGGDSKEFNASANSIRGNLDNVPGGSIDATGLLHSSITGEPIPGPRSFWEYTEASVTSFFLNHIGNTPEWETRVNRPNQCFIPSYSGIGIKNPNQSWSNPLNRNLVCSNETYFDSFFGESNNTKHVSLNYRSVNWLLKELGTNIDAPSPQAPHFPIQTGSLTGPNVLCDTNVTYLFADLCKVPSPVKYNDQNGNAINGWSIQGDLLIVSSTPYSVTVKGTSNLGNTGKIIATFQNGQIYEKVVWIGRPKFPSSGIVNGSSNTIYNQTITYTYSGTFPSGATSSYQWYVSAPMNDNGGPSCAWQILSGQGTNSITVKTGCIATTAVVAVRVTNSCGSDEKYMYVNISAGGTNGSGDPCIPTLKIYPNPIKGNSLQLKVLPPANPCDPNQKIIKNAVKIYDFYGNLVYDNSFVTNDILIDNLNLKSGNYILNVTTDIGDSVKEIIVIE